jgi:hypothetical protein
VAMNDEEALAEIVQTLTVDHGCHVVSDAAMPATWPRHGSSETRVVFERERYRTDSMIFWRDRAIGEGADNVSVNLDAAGSS